VFVENRFDCEGKVTEEREETNKKLKVKDMKELVSE